MTEKSEQETTEKRDDGEIMEGSKKPIAEMQWEDGVVVI